MPTDETMTIKDVAAFLKVSPRTVYNLINEGYLSGFKVGNSLRIMNSDVLNYIETQKKRFQSEIFDSRPAAEENFISLSDICAHIGTFRLKNISLKLPKNKVTAVLGPSGSGKTLLLKVIAGIESLDAGSIYYGKERFDTLNIHDRKIGFVFQDYALFPNLDTKRNLGFPLKIKAKTPEVREEADRIVAEIIKELQLPAEYLDLLPKQLPEGIKQLIAIGREKSHAQDLYLMDEPMSSLDKDIHFYMRQFIKRIIEAMDKTTIVVLNNPEDAIALSDYMAIIDDGSIIQAGPSLEVYNNPASIKVMEITSSMGLNRLQIRVANGITEPYGIKTDLLDGDYGMYFRPNDISIVTKGIEAKILDTVFYNSVSVLAHCELTTGEKIDLVIPSETEKKAVFMPGDPKFFKI